MLRLKHSATGPEIARLDRQTRQIAAGGARLEAVGLFAVAVGTLLQVMALLVA
jgi:hypothetical protein